MVIGDLGLSNLIWGYDGTADIVALKATGRNTVRVQIPVPPLF